MSRRSTIPGILSRTFSASDRVEDLARVRRVVVGEDDERALSVGVAGLGDDVPGVLLGAPGLAVGTEAIGGVVGDQRRGSAGEHGADAASPLGDRADRAPDGCGGSELGDQRRPVAAELGGLDLGGSAGGSQPFGDPVAAARSPSEPAARSSGASAPITSRSVASGVRAEVSAEGGVRGHSVKREGYGDRAGIARLG